jgi:DNA-binding NtrC family response regulator
MFEKMPEITRSKDSGAVRLSKPCIIVFSPDPDLARFLLMDMEETCEIVRLHTLPDFKEALSGTRASILVVDLCSFSGDIAKQLEILNAYASAIPLIVLRASRLLTPDLSAAIEKIAAHIFFKPADVELIHQTVQDMLE